MQNTTSNSFLALILTKENVIIYSHHDNAISHHEIFKEYREIGVTVKDCIIFKNIGKINIKNLLFSSINKFVTKNYESPVEPSTLDIKCHQKKNQFILLKISGLTQNDTPFSFQPSELINPQNNYFYEFMDI